MAGASTLIPSHADIIQVSDLKKGRTSMEHEQEQQDQRTFLAETYGDTPTEMELAALDEARAFFGDDVRLAIVPNYAVARPQSSPMVERAAELGKKYRALVRVRVV